MKKTVFGLCLLLLAPVGVARALGTPDGLPPSIETVCDPLRGTNAFGLCNAYCEAMDCDSPAPHASAQGCASVLENFVKKTGGPPPCEASCPCLNLPVFASFADGSTQIDTCSSDSSNFAVQTGTDGNGDSVSATVTRFFGEGMPVCQVTNGAGMLTTMAISDDQVEPCVQVLTGAAAAQNVSCAPE